MEVLFKREPPAPNNPVSNRWFAQLGRCMGFEARPAVVHFGGYKVRTICKFLLSAFLFIPPLGDLFRFFLSLGVGDCLRQQVGAVHTQYLKILNISGTAKRLHIVNPTTAEFKVRVEKCGVLAPGMVETLAVDFEPSEWKYHYDCIRIYTEADNLLVPIHAYPVMNEVNVPRRIDFGKCYLSETCKRVVRLACDVPIQFEFRLSIRKDHSDFRVSPLSGVVPADGSVEITIEFTPLEFGTCILELLVYVAQFNFEPILCTITGSCIPGMVRDQAIDEAASKFIESQGDDMTLGTSSTLSPQIFGSKGVLTAEQRKTIAATGTGEVPRRAASALIDSHLDPRVPFKSKGSGSGAVFDGGTEWMSAKTKARAGQQQRRRRRRRRRPEEADETEKGAGIGNISSSVGGETATADGESRPGVDDGLNEALVEGLRIPQEIEGVATVNYILTQQPGKLKPKALQAAIRAQRAIRAEQQAEQEELRASAGGGGGLSVHAIKAEEGTVLLQKQKEAKGKPAGQSRQLRELAFLQDLADLERDENEREFKSSQEALGSALLTPEEVDAIVTQRHKVERKLGLMERSAHRALLSSRLRGPYEKPSNYARAEILASATPENFEPTFDAFVADVWAKRRTTLQRLIYLVGKWVTRRRADRRIRAIKARLEDCTTREDVRALVELDNQQAAAEGSRGGVGVSAAVAGAEDNVVGALGADAAPLSLLKFEISGMLIQSTVFPCFEEEGSTSRLPVVSEDVRSPIAFEDLAFFSLRQAQEAAVMRYDEITRLPVDTYVPPRPVVGAMRAGAHEECGVRSPRGMHHQWSRKDAVESQRSEVQAQKLAAASTTAGGVWLSPPVPDTDNFSAVFGTLLTGWGHTVVEGSRFGGDTEAVVAVDLETQAAFDKPEETKEPSIVTLANNVNALGRRARVGADPEGIFEPTMISVESGTARTLCGVNVELLRPSEALKVFSTATASLPGETDGNWALRPQRVTYDVPQNYGSRVGNSVGASALYSCSEVPTMHRNWRPRRQRRSSALSSLSEQHSQLLWQHLGLPARRSKGLLADDIMSDSESEDEGDADMVIPTATLVKGFFDPDRRDSTASSAFDQISDIFRDRKAGFLESRKLKLRQKSAIDLPQVKPSFFFARLLHLLVSNLFSLLLNAYFPFFLWSRFNFRHFDY